MPGVRLNFSNSGVSTTLGPRGATVTLGKRGPRGNVGLPGTGLSYSTALRGGRRQSLLGAEGGTGTVPNADFGGCAALGLIVFLLLGIATCAGYTDTTPTAETRSNPAAAPAKVVYVAADRLNCRMVPASGATVARKLDRNTEVKVLEEQDGWSKVEHLSLTCWASSKFLSDTLQALPAAQAFASPIPSARKAPQSRAGKSARSGLSASRRSAPPLYDSEGCPCSGNQVCIGPRGGRYCITSGGNKRYGV